MHKRNSLRHNSNFKKRIGFIIETAITLPIGAIIAFVFERRMMYAMVALAFFLFLFLIYCIVLIVQDSKVSVLSIMKEGLNDGRYEDVIKFGSAMSPTLFSSNKNIDRVKLGRLLLEACNKLSETDHSKRDDILIATGGSEKTVKQIKIELLLDDLGWSLYLVDPTGIEAPKNIQEAIRLARQEIKRLNNKNKKSGVPDKSIEKYMKLIMRGYRHLTGIYYSSNTTLGLAQNYERITQYILSCGHILSLGGVCSNKVSNSSDCACGRICHEHNYIKCILNNIKNIYFSPENKVPEKVTLEQFINFYDVQLNVSDIKEDRKNFKLLSSNAKETVIREQSYAWSRNIVKWLQKNIHYSSDISFKTTVELDNLPMISDDERARKVAEAIAFARLYYYGTNAFVTEDYNDFDEVISTELIKKEQQRYLTLCNEISLIDFNRQLLSDEDIDTDFGVSGTHNPLIETALSHIHQTRDACRGLRADLFARNTAMLMKALLLQYNLNFRYNMSIDNSDAVKLSKILEMQSKIQQLYEEVVKYEHCDNPEVKMDMLSVKKELTIAKKEIKKWKFVYRKIGIPQKTLFDIEQQSVHSIYDFNDSKKIIEQVKGRWNI